MNTKLNKKKLEVVLSEANLEKLIHVVKHGRNNVRVITRARILILSHHGKTNLEIINALECAPRMICNVRRRFLQEADILKAVADADRSGQPKRVTPTHEAYVTALACTNPPKGHNHWTLPELKKKLLNKYKKLKTISDERIRHMLLKSELKPWLKKKCGAYLI